MTQDYTPHAWSDGAGGGTPIDAAALNEMETGIDDAAIGIVTSLPGSPAHGQEVYFEVESGLLWHLIYDSTIVDADKWVFLGGPPRMDEVLTQESTGSTSYTDLATVGPQVTVPLAGDYEVEFGGEIRSATGGSRMSPELGSTAATDDDSASHDVTGSSFIRVSRKIRADGLSANDEITLKYKTGGTTFLAQRRNLAVRPIRVS